MKMKLMLTLVMLIMVICTAFGQHTIKRRTIVEKFDIEDYENRRDQSVGGVENLNHFQLRDGTEIFRAAYTNNYTDERILPEPSFLKQYKEFYLSGFIKAKGFPFGNLAIGATGIKVGEWVYFDEIGEVRKKVNEDSKFGKFDYNALLAFLDKEGLIDVKTGRNREKMKVFFENSKNGTKVWTVDVITEYLADAYSRGWKYKLDGDSGRVLDKSKINITYVN